MKKLQSGETAAHIPSLGSKQRRVGARGWLGCRATVNMGRGEFFFPFWKLNQYNLVIQSVGYSIDSIL